MLFDWLSREGGIVLSWWLLVTLAGAAALPLCLRLLSGLPDRGYTLARAAGLLLVGFVFWLLASLGFLDNTTGSMALAWLIVLLLGLALYFAGGRERIDLRAWWRENSRVVIVGEILFFVLLFGWSIVRAYQNNLVGTEKAMELAFLSSTMRSPTFPPADPWLSGYAISYYYFGYVIMAMLSLLSGVSSTVGFGMTTALLVALTGLGAFGVGYNLVRSRAFNAMAAKKIGQGRGVAIAAGLLGAVLIVFMGNFELPLVELPYRTGIASTGYLQLWNMNDLQTPLAEGQGSGDLAVWSSRGWWWWHSARVISDRNLNGVHSEVIDEFPQFSFLLADNHPHVLALPFVMLALAAALNTLLTRRRPSGYEIAFYGVIVGGLIFLNTWDGPIYLIILLGAEALRRLIANGTGRLRRSDWTALVLLGAEVLLLAVVFYLPFLAAFRSQAAGIAPNLLNPTMPGQFFLMFAPFILLIAPFLAVEAWRAGRRMNWRVGIVLGLLLLVGLIGAMLLLGLAGMIVPSIQATVDQFVFDNGGWGTVAVAAFAKRLAYLPTALLLVAGLILVIGRLFPRRIDDGDEQSVVSYTPQTGFVLLLIAAGLVLTLVPEFVYLRDNFGTRMNTVFKFYYQAWIVFGISGAYGIVSFFAGQKLPRPGWRIAYGGTVVAVLAGGLLFPVLGIDTRMFYESGRNSYDVPATLDGGPTLTSADDYQAALCLSELVPGDDAVVASAVGGSYAWSYGAVSTLTGIPTVLNWTGHEGQWRGSTYSATVGSREPDIHSLYSDPTWNTTRSIIERYGINYIVFGSSERSAFGDASEIKFLDNLDVACQSGDTRIFRVPEQLDTVQLNAAGQ